MDLRGGHRTRVPVLKLSLDPGALFNLGQFLELARDRSSGPPALERICADG